MAGFLSLPARAAELVMFEEEGCEWCQVWNETIAPVYPKTPEGGFAPLRRVDISDDQPKDLQHINGVHFTPTFVIMDGGKEVGRIIGYPGEEFFWGLLEEILRKAGFESNAAPVTN
ncbi:MAG: hypothetical protein QGH73_06960 [Rhodospirillales bacterium]|nr:hypothetical protein [Rhodospirillaceae bacterium]MDP6427637.1 hypothetical protein [Rhodospirillales bacterium]MDP6644823.1 hypothetical protein [Rhodospirillales bacterium]MDP6841402.1 hypothetical protein [Rhodospirillales bacterium]